MTGSLADAIVFALSVTLPSILLLVLGWYLQYSDQVDNRFCDQASKIVFRYSLPALLFFSIYGSNVDFASQLRLVLAGCASALVLFIGAEIIARYRIASPKDQGVFVQGVYRANTVIVGLAFVSSAYGPEGVATGAVFGGAMTLLYNVLAVLTLSRATATDGKLNPRLMLRQIASNPLVIAILLALAARALAVPVSSLLKETGHYLAVLSLPLALICAGATLDMRSLFNVSGVSLWASLGRLLVAPIVAVLAGFAFGLQGMTMGVLYLMSATPVAAASYVMAKAMGANDVAAANILGLTTVGAMPVAAIGISFLHAMGWM